MTSGENDEEAAWLDLVANYDTPAEGGWPDREDLPGGAPVTGTATKSPYASEAPQVNPRPANGQAAGPAGGPPFGEAPRPSAQAGPGEAADTAATAEEHYIPPPPPPLPKLDPIAKGAWTALFGGPAYLLIATAIGWTVPAVAAFCAIGAFVGGFATLVLRMSDDPPRGSGGDDGAVVLPAG